jgi:hypothetical protein
VDGEETALAEGVFVTAKFAIFAAPTIVSTVAELLVKTGSFVPEVTESVSTICVPLAVAAFTWTTIVNVMVFAAPEGTSGSVQLMLPVVVQVHAVLGLPRLLVSVKETNDVFAGKASVKTAFNASCGPLFVTV